MTKSFIKLIIGLGFVLGTSVSYADIDFNSLINENNKSKEKLHDTIRANIQKSQKNESKNIKVVLVDEESEEIAVNEPQEVVSSSKLSKAAKAKKSKTQVKIDQELLEAELFSN